MSEDDIMPEMSARLDRIEDKLDRMGDALLSLVRLEERLITVFNRQDRYDADQVKLTARIHEVEKIIFGRGAFFRWLDRLGMAVVGAAAAGVLQYLSQLP